MWPGGADRRRSAPPPGAERPRGANAGHASYETAPERLGSVVDEAECRSSAQVRPPVLNLPAVVFGQAPSGNPARARSCALVGVCLRKSSSDTMTTKSFYVTSGGSSCHSHLLMTSAHPPSESMKPGCTTARALVPCPQRFHPTLRGQGIALERPPKRPGGAVPMSTKRTIRAARAS